MRVVVAVLLAAACSGSNDTCAVRQITYAGTATGRVIVNGGWEVDRSKLPLQLTTAPLPSAYPTVEAATAIPPARMCWAGEALMPLDETAFIDVEGRYPGDCPAEGCTPSTTDPVGTARYARAGSEYRVAISIRDR